MNQLMRFRKRGQDREDEGRGAEGRSITALDIQAPGSASICSLQDSCGSRGTAFGLGLVSVLKSSTFHSQNARIN